MGIFFQNHLDYVFFVYGLAFVLLAAICAVIPNESARGVPWIWLGLFGLTHGFTEWMEIFALDLQDTPAFNAVRFATMTLSLVFLSEYGRATLGKLQGKVPGRWIYVPLLALAAVGALGGMASLQATTRYALGLTGGLWAAWALYRLDKQDKRSGGRLAVAAIGLTGYAVAAGVVVSRAPLFPASVINADWFFSAVGVPVQMLRGALGVLIATALWSYSGRLRRIDLSAAENESVAPLGYGLVIMLAVALVAGWHFTEFASEWSDDEVRDLLRVQAGTAVVALTAEEIAPLRGTTVDRREASYRHLKQQMQAVSRANPELRFLHLLILRDGKILEAVAVDAKDPGRMETGQAYEHPSTELLQAFSPGNVTTLGPYLGGPGDHGSRDLGSAFAPIRDLRTDVVLGVLGIDIGADDWKRSVALYRLTAMFTTLLVVLLVIYLFIERERMWRSAQLHARSETRLAAAQRMAQIGSWNYDHWSGRITWSEEVFRIYGRDSKLGAPSDPEQLKALTHPQDWPRLRTVMRQAIDEGADYQLEFRVLRPDGSLRQVEATAHASCGDDGEVMALTGTVQDVTERKQAEEALRDSAESLRLFADNVPAMTASWDQNQRCRFANKMYSEFYGFTVENILGKHVREVAGDDAYRGIEGHFVRALQGHPVTYQRTRTFANGESRYIEVKLLPHIGERGKVLGCFSVTIDITEHRLAEERIQRVAHHDSLTGLPNRLLFNDRLSQAISLAKRDSRQFALLYLDLDRFKQVNDSLGHTAGDELLHAVALRIRRQVRESDTVARVGGDEFTVILSDIARREEAKVVANKIIVAISAPFQLGSNKQSANIGTSIGIALYPVDGRDAEALVKAADAAMYSAKQAGNGLRFAGRAEAASPE